MIAHYIKTKKKKVLIISNDNRPIGKEISVSGKVEAKKICKEYNLKPWNF